MKTMTHMGLWVRLVIFKSIFCRICFPTNDIIWLDIETDRWKQSITRTSAYFSVWNCIFKDVLVGKIHLKYFQLLPRIHDLLAASAESRSWTCEWFPLVGKYNFIFSCASSASEETRTCTGALYNTLENHGPHLQMLIRQCATVLTHLTSFGHPLYTLAQYISA